MGTTLGKKEGVKSSVRTKKVVAVKRVSKKTVERKPAEAKTKTTPKVAAKKATIRTKKPTEAKVTTAPEVVFVPGAASLRLLEKVHLYTIWYERHVPGVMTGVAKVSGYAFIFLGAVFAVFSYIDAKNIISTPAALVCSESLCTDVPDEDMPFTAPKISFINSIPGSLSSDTDFKISALNTIDPTITLTAIETGSTILLESPERVNETEYRFLIPAGRLTPASYQIEATAEHDGATYTFTGPTFVVGEKQLSEAVVSEVTTAVMDEAASSTEVVGDEVISASSSDSVIEESIVSEEELDTEQKTTSTTTEDKQEQPEVVSVTGELSPISIALHKQGASSYLKILTGDFTPTKVDVYSQLFATGQPLHLGQATLVQGEWVFNISALNLLQASHYLYASFVLNGKTYKSEAVTYEPATESYSSLTTETDLNVLVQKIELALLASSVSNENRRRYFDYFATQPEMLFAESDELQFANKDLLTAIDVAMRADTDSLQPLLLQYAAAVQAESEFLISLSNKALTEHYTKLASVISITIAEPAAVPAIHTVLALRYQVLKDRIRESEEQIKQDTNNLTAKDSDQDGVSDFDEVANFGTNSLLADTDSDGVVDSIELIRGGDLTAPDQVVTPGLNKNIEELTYDAVVEINSVSAQAMTTKDGDPEEYFVAVEGRSIPNSYVYLLSYSTGVVEVVKTGATGLFSYTIEREFEIGDHEITAVLTDVAGEIVASSKPYRFARTNNALVAAAAMSTTVENSGQSTEDNVLLNLLVAAVGVITFGFILLLLSNTLRNRRPQKTQLA